MCSYSTKVWEHYFGEHDLSTLQQLYPSFSPTHIHLNEARVAFNILNHKCTVVTFIVNGFSKGSTLNGCQMPRASAGTELFTKVIGQHKCQRTGQSLVGFYQTGTI